MRHLTRDDIRAMGILRAAKTIAVLTSSARLADRMHAPWYAVYVRTPSEDPTRVDAATQRYLGDTLALAHQLTIRRPWVDRPCLP